MQETDHLDHCVTNRSPKEAYVIFNDLMKEFKKLTRTAQEMMPWISEETWRLVNSRIILRRRHTVGQRELWAEMSLFQAALQEDKRWRVSMLGADIEALVSAELTRKALSKIQRR